MQTLEQASPNPNTYTPYSEDKITSSACQANSSLVKRTINEEGCIDVYPHCVIYTPQKKYNPEYKPKHTTRSKIKTFSKRSRFRLFEAMAKIKTNLTNQPFFVSLTYHYGHQSKENSDKTCLHNFLVSLRDFDKNVQYIWRIDLQKRGAPHYHLIIFPSPFKKLLSREYYKIKVCSMWHRIADPKSKKHKDFGADIQNITNYRHACIYINKYLAKVPDNQNIIEKGKHWGCSRKLPNRPFEHVKLTRMTRSIVISKLRLWLLRNGKERYANEEFFNEYRSQTVFIDIRDFYTIMGDNLNYIDFSHL
ncbi:MAG: hypothetical protein KAJ51_15145 [Thermoplasmata archaeon]|nr:hypothetical protein [Thermoplasmata archaeon]